MNLVGVFSVKKPGLVKGRRILLVDDIMTTGSTLEHCAKALKNAGAAYIDAYVVAIRHRS
nr:phosphoribosyltransferase family protein [Thermoclostridium stercorarium]